MEVMRRRGIGLLTDRESDKRRYRFGSLSSPARPENHSSEHQ
jgi:hypothetical protein